MLRKTQKIGLIATMVSGMMPILSVAPAQAANSDLTLTSSNTSLVNYFNWAKERALSLDATLPNIQAARESVGCTTPNGCEDPRVKNLYTGFVYLSDLDWDGTPTIGWGTVHKDRSVGGNELNLSGVTFPSVRKGIGTHANSEITYNLNGQYAKFSADVGVDSEVGSIGSVQFQVFADGVQIGDSVTKRGGENASHVEIDLPAGTNKLTLKVTDAGDGINSDHADWVNAGVFKANYTPPLIPAYWGSYADDFNHFREAFCVRDITHQSAAGHLLNMDNQNYSMFNTFAKAANNNKSNPYWPKWSFDFFGNGYYMDQDWRELPYPFEVVEKGYQQYLWTGDKKWIGLNEDGTVDSNSDLYTYYTNVHTRFMDNQDQDGNGVADETKQLATYWEDNKDHLFEAGDAIGSQYQALLAYSKILEARGDASGAATYLQKATDLRNYFANNWYSNADSKYIRGFTKDSNGSKVPVSTWGHEASIFMPLKLITDQGSKTDSYINFIDQEATAHHLGTEATTYLPEMFYLQGRNDLGWKWMSDIMKGHPLYPENSFMFVSNTVTGLMGVQPDAPNHKVATVPRLTSNVDWVQADHVKIGDNDLTVRHDGTSQTTLTNNSGDDITWEAEFYGNYSQLTVSNGSNSSVQQAIQKDLNGKQVSYVSVTVPAGNSITVGEPNYVSDLNWASTPTIGWGTIQKDKSVNSNELKLYNTKYSKGIGTHANSEIVYNLNGQYSKFTAIVGVDDEVGTNNGSVKFQVFLDDNTTPIYDSGTKRSGEQPSNVDVDVRGKNKLTLKVIDNGDGISNDHADWADAKLFK